ncbi:MAG: hypothetical protein JSV94_02975 [Methanobacteriota archaeon]|nr:MAG: hypothetical protein JSV94_02975 [Euryarchaeota archaeon]
MPHVISDLGNGVTMRFDGRTYSFDPRHVLKGSVNLVSHAHADHVPAAMGNAPIVCSHATLDLIRLRRKKVEGIYERTVTVLEAGHVPGSSMFIVDADHDKTMYTGDFCTRRKRHIEPATPRQCDVLVMETTYGRPEYEFPRHNDTVDAIRDWVDAVLRSGSNAVLFAYPLGKAQELCFELRGYPIRLQGTIAEINRVLAAHGHELHVTCDVEDHVDKRPFVYITSGLGSERGKVDSMIEDGAKAASFSGWSLKRFMVRSTRRRIETFPLSDHCDFNESMEFVRRCGPTKVYTTHGFAREFARSVKSELGIDAEPLTTGQEKLDAFV